MAEKIGQSSQRIGATAHRASSTGMLQELEPALAKLQDVARTMPRNGLVRMAVRMLLEQTGYVEPPSPEILRMRETMLEELRNGEPARSRAVAIMLTNGFVREYGPNMRRKPRKKVAE